jgi:hypothetical protein
MAWISELVGIDYTTQAPLCSPIDPQGFNHQEYLSKYAYSKFDWVPHRQQSEKGAGDGTVLEGMTSNERVLDKRKDVLGANCMRHLHTGLDSGALRAGR